MTEYSHFQLIDEHALDDPNAKDLQSALLELAPYVIVPGHVWDTSSPTSALLQAQQEAPGGTLNHPHPWFPQLVIPKTHIHVFDGAEIRNVDWKERPD